MYVFRFNGTLMVKRLRLQEILLLDRDEIDLGSRRFKALNIKYSERRKRWLDHSDTSVTEIYAHDIDSMTALDIGL